MTRELTNRLSTRLTVITALSFFLGPFGASRFSVHEPGKFWPIDSGWIGLIDPRSTIRAVNCKTGSDRYGSSE